MSFFYSKQKHSLKHSSHRDFSRHYKRVAKTLLLFTFYFVKTHDLTKSSIVRYTCIFMLSSLNFYLHTYVSYVNREWKYGRDALFVYNRVVRFSLDYIDKQ